MDCKAFRETLDLYIDDELAPPDAQAAHLHEQGCASCKSVNTSLLNLRRQMKLAVAQCQPPLELIEAVEGISQPRWKRLLEHFGVTEVGSHTQVKSFPVGRRGILVTLCVVVFLVISVVVVYEVNCLAHVMRLRSHNPTSTALMDARENEARINNREAKRNQTWVSIEKISPSLQRAVIAGEDPNFTTHRGFDYEAIQNAWEQEQEEAKHEAESNPDAQMFQLKKSGPTISQQLAKNLFLSSKRTVLRKSQEAIITIFLERSLTKRRILEIYLNVIEWGDGIYGAEAAAQHYFHKTAAALMPEEAAFLSAMIPNPRTFLNPELNPKRVTRRQRIILRDMDRVEIP